jgi:hypothetical protein
MNRILPGLALACVAALAQAGPPHGGWRPPPGVYPGVPVRPLPPVVRPVYPGWGAGYWGPRTGFYVGAPVAYWGAWNGWNGWGYPAPVTVSPWVVASPPVTQVIVTPQPAPEPSAASYWYYCPQPAGYFPYVQQCGQAWMKVVPQVPGSSNLPPQLAP